MIAFRVPDLPVKGVLEFDYVFVRPKEVSRRCVRVKHILDLAVRAVRVDRVVSSEKPLLISIVTIACVCCNRTVVWPSVCECERFCHFNKHVTSLDKSTASPLVADLEPLLVHQCLPSQNVRISCLFVLL